jgi:hypothetical protein
MATQLSAPHMTPYKIWLKEKGFVEITEDDFKKWRNS